MTQAPAHIPVMLDQVLAALEPKGAEVYVDATFGRGGYTRAILTAAACGVVGIDRDPAAADVAKTFADEFGPRFGFKDAPFSQLARLFPDPVDAVILDLGVSSPQLDTPERGFSFRFDGPLDMRMDPRGGPSAAEVVNTAQEQDLADIIYTYGEERQSRRIARAIIEARNIAPIETTEQLAGIVRRVVRHSGKDASDPATRTFQALRLWVNQELQELQAVLWAALQILRAGGRLIVVTFHSLEDRIVKQFFRDHSGAGPGLSRHTPGPGRHHAPVYLTLPQKGAVEPHADEIRINPRARSAKMRVAIRTAEPFQGGAS